MVIMDETTVFMSQGSQTIVDQMDASTIWIPCTCYESAQITYILAIRLTGKMCLREKNISESYRPDFCDLNLWDDVAGEDDMAILE